MKTIIVAFKIFYLVQWFGTIDSWKSVAPMRSKTKSWAVKVCFVIRNEIVLYNDV